MTAACIGCGHPADHAHHVVPQSLGGKGTVPLCEHCHGIVHERGGMLGHRNLVRAGLDAARARGVRLGRPRAPGPSPAAVAALRAKGQSWSQIAARHGCTPALARRRYQETVA